MNDGVCCYTFYLKNLQQSVYTIPNLAYAIVTPLSATARGNFLLDFASTSMAYEIRADVYVLGSSSVTKAQLGIINSSELSSVRSKRFRFLIRMPQPSVSAMVGLNIIFVAN